MKKLYVFAIFCLMMPLVVHASEDFKQTFDATLLEFSKQLSTIKDEILFYKNKIAQLEGKKYFVGKDGVIEGYQKTLEHLYNDYLRIDLEQARFIRGEKNINVILRGSRVPKGFRNPQQPDASVEVVLSDGCFM